MKKEIGKLYTTEYGNTVVLCTGEAKDNRFPGVVVQYDDKHGIPDKSCVVGHFSATWVDHSFKYEHISPILLDNNLWKPYVEMGHSAG